MPGSGSAQPPHFGQFTRYSLLFVQRGFLPIRKLVLLLTILCARIILNSHLTPKHLHSVQVVVDWRLMKGLVHPVCPQLCHQFISLYLGVGVLVADGRTDPSSLSSTITPVYLLSM
jgi:hypothetical protein